jgi:hypothetical protein
MGNGGIYNNAFVGVRVEEAEENTIEDLHDILCEHQKNDNEGELIYSLTPVHTLYGNLALSPFRRCGRTQSYYGNCSEVIGDALKSVGLTKSTHSFPKRLILQLLHEATARNSQNTNLVYYQRVPGAVAIYAKALLTCDGLVHGMQSAQTEDFFFSLEKFAHAIVSVPPGSQMGEVRPVEVPKKSVLAPGKFASLGPTLLCPMRPNLICLVCVLMTLLFPLGYGTHFVLAIINVLTYFETFGIDYALIQVTQLTLTLPLLALVFLASWAAAPHGDVVSCIESTWSHAIMSDKCATSAPYLCAMCALSLMCAVLWNRLVYRSFC